MLERVGIVHTGVVQDGPRPEPDADVGSLLPTPVYSGDLDGLLDTRPVFRSRVNGYDRLQVDNYVTWAEEELAAARRAGDHLLARFAVCAAELAEFRRQPPTSAPASVPTPANPDLATVSERVREILRLASDEAADIIEAATEEADGIVAEARVEAEARLQKTELMREAAVAMVEQMRERVVRERAESVSVLEQARQEADQLLRQAAAERDRLAAEAAARLAADADRARQDRDSAAAVAAGRLLAVQDEVDDLRRQRDEARESLRRLTDQIGEALHAVSVVVADEPNIAREYPLRPIAS
jgi:cell division septum initiation protein DivIVA